MSGHDKYLRYQWRYEKEDFKYCPRCGSQISLEDIHIANQPQLVCDNCEFIFYLDPKVVVTAIISNSDKVLLLKRAEAPSIGKWGLVGGHVSRGEDLIETIKNEAMEEAGIQIEVNEILCYYVLPGKQGLQLVFLATTKSTEIRSNIESFTGEFFEQDNIPWKELAFETTRLSLEKYFGKEPKCR